MIMERWSQTTQRPSSVRLTLQADAAYSTSMRAAMAATWSMSRRAPTRSAGALPSTAPLLSPARAKATPFSSNATLTSLAMVRYVGRSQFPLRMLLHQHPRDAALWAPAPANAGISMIYSNCQQQGVAVYNVAMYPYLRGCIDTDTGYGGASDFTITGFFCSMNSSSTNPGIKLAYSASVNTIRDFILESSSLTGDGILLNGPVHPPQ